MATFWERWRRRLQRAVEEILRPEAPEPPELPEEPLYVPRDDSSRWDIPPTWSTGDQALFDNLVRGQPPDDEVVRRFERFMYAMRHYTGARRQNALEDLSTALYVEYGIDFRAAFDWQGFREVVS